MRRNIRFLQDGKGYEFLPMEANKNVFGSEKNGLTCKLEKDSAPLDHGTVEPRNHALNKLFHFLL